MLVAKPTIKEIILKAIYPPLKTVSALQQTTVLLLKALAKAVAAVDGKSILPADNQI